MKDPVEEKQGDPQRLDETLRQRLEGLVPEIIRRLFYAGLGAVFTTEEGVRRLANEFSLPKDVARYLIQQAQSTKDDLFRVVATELRAFLESLNINEELQRLLTSLSFEIKTEIRFVPNEQKVLKPSVKNKVSVRRRPRQPDAELPPDEEVTESQQNDAAAPGPEESEPAAT